MKDSDNRDIEADSSAAIAAEPGPIDDAIKRLAQLNPIAFDRVADAEAKRLACKIGTLRDEVKKVRRGDGGGTGNGQGRPIELPEVEPWPEPVDGAALLTSLVSTLRQYVILTYQQAVAIALWVLFTHAFNGFDVAPKLVARSAQKRCGKSRLAEVLERLVRLPLLTSGIKPAALLRIIEMHAPTLLLDEMDVAMKQDREMAEALRGLINSGFNRSGARYIMNVPTPDGGFEPRQFSTWAPQLLSGIGDLPDTVRDRSIEIEMKRKLKSEKVRRLRRNDGNDLHELQRRATRWAGDNMEKLHLCRPEMPQELSDRAADAWEPLFAIAGLAGGEWPERARTAAPALSGDSVIEDGNFETMLLADIRVISASDTRAITLNDEGKRITSANLVSALVEMADRPWSDYRKGKPITQNGLSRLLKDFGIRPGSIRIGHTPEDTKKGYLLDQFEDAFARYLPDQTVTPSQPKQTAPDSGFSNVTPGADVTDAKARKVAESATCDGVTDESTHRRGVRL